MVKVAGVRIFKLPRCSSKGSIQPELDNLINKYTTR